MQKFTVEFAIEFATEFISKLIIEFDPKFDSELDSQLDSESNRAPFDPEVTAAACVPADVWMALPKLRLEDHRPLSRCLKRADCRVYSVEAAA